MALIRCSECGSMISDKAQRCPRCGCPVGHGMASSPQRIVNNGSVDDYPEKSSSRKWLYALIGLLAAALVGGGIVAYNKLSATEGDNSATTPDTAIVSHGQSVGVSSGDDQTATRQVESEQATRQSPQQTPSQTTHRGGIRATLTGEISTIQNVKMVLQGKTGTLSYVMDGKRTVSNIVLDEATSRIDKNGFGHLVLKSFTPGGKLKGRFIGEMDVAECGYIYEGQFVNVNGGSTTFFLTEL